MGGGLMQLVAYGAQDIYLTGNPQITFFKVVYRRHTNFAMESIEQAFTGSVGFGRKCSCTIDRNGDLLHKMYLEVDVTTGGVQSSSLIEEGRGNLGHSLIREVEINIGGQCVDKHYGEWLELWSQLTNSEQTLHKLRTLTRGTLRSGNATNNGSRKMYIPLQFWFNRNPGLALPLIALQYHEVKLTVFLNDEVAATGATGEVSDVNMCLFCDYIFLDTDERRRFAQVSHEYLIEQLQYNNCISVKASETASNVELRFNHPCKELVWVAQQTASAGNGANAFRYGQGGNSTTDNVVSAKLQLNGHDRFREREGSYFRCVQPYQHHTGGHKQDGNGNGMMYVYSFGLEPEEHQPSGTCNFSRIDNAVLQLQLHTTDDKFVKVYATNYNVLRVMSGMGGLAYSN
jgi:hypothetical protein